MSEQQTPTQEITPVVVNRNEQGLQVFDSTHAWLVGQHIAPNATPAEIQLFLMQARSLDLNPFTGQIWLVPRKDSNHRTVHKSEIGVAGFRFVAERSGNYGGSLDPEWLDAEGNWHDVWISHENPVAARVRVVRKDWDQPSTGTVTWKATAVKKRNGDYGPFWSNGKGANQLAKCAEVLALRKAFPDLAGVLLEGETGDMGPEEVTATRTELDPEVKAVWGEFMQLAATMPDASEFKRATLFELQDHEDGPLEKLVASEMTIGQAEAVLTAAKVWVERPFDGSEEE